MAPYKKGLGKMGKLAGSEDSFMRMVISTKVSGSMTKTMVLVNIFTSKMAPGSKEVGTKRRKLEAVRNHGLMEPSLQGNTSMGRSTDRGPSSGLMVLSTPASSSTTTFTAKEHTSGQMESNTQENGI